MSRISNIINLRRYRTDELELNLQIAGNEIDNLVAENCAFKNLNLEKDYKLELLQGLCKSTLSRSTKKLKKININTSKLESAKRKTETFLNELPDESQELKIIEAERIQTLQNSPKSIQQRQLHSPNKKPTRKYFRKICILSRYLFLVCINYMVLILGLAR